MSLINDALKQIKQARQQSPPPQPAPLSPVEADPPEGFGWSTIGIILLLVAAAGIFVGLSLPKSTPLKASATSARTHLVSATPPRAPRLPSTAATHQTEHIAITPVPTKSALSNSIPAVAVSSRPPELKLQGILFAATRPCAIVNGRTIFSGDHINGFRVMMISKDSITLRNQTGTRVLSLNPQ